MDNWPVCNCETCVAMCLKTPCLGTPLDMERLIEAGFGPRLMISDVRFYPNHYDLLLPAVVRYEGQRHGSRMGPCTFLKGDLCDLHDLSLKPTEGKAVSHSGSPDWRQDLYDELWGAIQETWDTDWGRAVVRRWATLYKKG